MMDLILSSVGIIGGADGPTAIYVNGDASSLILIASVLLTALSFGLVLHRRRKK